MSVIVEVDAPDGAAAFITALHRHRIQFLDAEIWDETGLVRTLRMSSPPVAHND